MELKVYNGEFFERGTLWYVAFIAVILLVVVFSVLSKNYGGGILVFIIAGGYFFYQTKANNKIKIKVGDKALQIGKTPYVRENMKGFVLEYHIKQDKIKNIVFIDNTNSVRIYTIVDSVENLKKFVDELNSYIPMMESYNQSFSDRIIRKIKL